MSCVCHAFASVLCYLVSPAGKGLTSLLLFVLFNCVFVTFPFGILGQVWYVIASIPDLCHLSFIDIERAVTFFFIKLDGKTMTTCDHYLAFKGQSLSMSSNKRCDVKRAQSDLDIFNVSKL